MILLNYLKLENFLSHKDSEIHFGANEKLLIDGNSGSGKSTLIEAIVWALYGTGRVENRFLVRRGEKKATVTLSLLDGEEEYRIIRSTTPKGTHTLEVLHGTGPGSKLTHIDRAGIRDIQSWIENEFLHASYLLFVNSIAYIQDNSDTFVKQSAAKRKELLLEIVRANQYADLYKKVGDRILVESGEQVRIGSKIAMLEDTKNRLTTIANELMNYSIAEQQLTSELEIATDKLSKLKEAEEKFKNLLEEVKQKESMVRLIKSSIDRITQKIKENENKITTHKTLEEKTRVAQEEVDAIGDVGSKKEELGKRIELEKERIFKLSFARSNRIIPIDYVSQINEIDRQIRPLAEESGKCPSGDDCPLGEPMRKQIRFLEEEKLKRQALAKEQAKAIEEQDNSEKELHIPLVTEEEKEEYKTYEELSIKKERLLISIESNKLLNSSTDPTAIEKENKELEEEVGKLGVDMAEEMKKKEIAENKLLGFSAEATSKEITSLNGTITILTSELRKAQGDVRTAQNALGELKETEKLLTELNEERKKVDGNLEALVVTKEAFSQRGIPAVVVDYMVPRLEEKINTILSRLSDFRMRIDTQRKAASGDGMVEGLFLTIYNESGEEFDYDSYSGGQKVKISVAIAEALASLQKVGFRIMDETFTALDEESTDEFVEVVEKLQAQFGQILCITHLRNVKDLFGEKVTVTRTNGLSTLIK